MFLIIIWLRFFNVSPHIIYLYFFLFRFVEEKKKKPFVCQSIAIRYRLIAYNYTHERWWPRPKSVTQSFKIFLSVVFVHSYAVASRVYFWFIDTYFYRLAQLLRTSTCLFLLRPASAQIFRLKFNNKPSP